MTYILCRWMNKELSLSQVIEPQTFARNFSNGYLIGEILHRYHLLTDLTLFDNDDSKSSKVNNFNHLKPILELLGISFDGITAQELMQEKQGVASHLIYELYVALEKKKKGNIGGTVADMISNATSNHTRMKEQYLYSERLHRGFGFSANTKLCDNSRLILNEDHQDCKSMEAHSAQQKKTPPVKDKIRQINATTTVREAKTLQKQQDQQRRREKQAHALQNEIYQFEANTRSLITTAKSELKGHSIKTEAESMERFNSEYIQQIRLRVKTDADTQKQRDRRVSHFLVEQSKARKAEQDTQFEDSLVKRLTRQTKNEERLVAQLLQIHSEREVLMTNNLIRQQQIQKRRERDFQEALEREAALAQQERLANAAEIQQELDLCKKFTAERKQHRYTKHFNICKEIVGQIVDLSTKAGDYLKLTGSLIPRKQMREWKELLFSGLPLYETDHEENNGLDPVGLLKQDVLNKHDYQEYKNMVGEWAWPRTQKMEIAPTNSSVFDHVIVRLRNTVHPPIVKSFPPFSLKACVLGKSCSGKSTCLDKIAQAHGVYVLSPDKLVDEVLNAYHRIVEGSEQQEIANNPFTDDGLGKDPKEEITNTKWALLGEAVHKVTGEGKAVPNELLVDVVTEKIRQLPANSGWILDGFPVDIIQAHLLERALGGAVEEVGEVSDYHTNLTDPPKASAPALDLAMFFDIKDECVASRAASQTDQNKLTVISSRIAAFEDTWPELEEWFGKKQNILVSVSADADETELFKTVETILQQPPAGSWTLRPLDSSLNNCLPFVDEPLPLDIAASLCLQWDTASETYVNKVTAVLQDLRLQCTAIELHFFNYREEFKMYLNRTDPKRDFISQWQKDFNGNKHDVRRDEAKLQERIDDLLEELWDISDKRREENEQKMAAVKEDGRLETCAAVLQQHHSTLLQVEVERFQDTLCILKTYYLSMWRQTMSNKDLQLQEESIIYTVQQMDNIKAPHENSISDYDDALATVFSLMLAGAQLIKRDKDEKSPFPSTDIKSYPIFKQGDDEQANIDSSETAVHGSTALDKIYYEYLAALNQAGDDAKARLYLINSHDFEMVNALQSKADQAIDSLKMLVKEQFVEEMKSIEHMAEVLHHHIEFDPKLKNGLDLLSYLSHQNVDDSPGTGKDRDCASYNLM